MNGKLQVEFNDGRVGRFSPANGILQEVLDRLPRCMDEFDRFLPRWAMAVERMGAAAVKRVRIEDGPWYWVGWPRGRSAAARARRLEELCIIELATRTPEQREKDFEALVPDLEHLG